MPRALLNRPGTGLTMSGGLRSADPLLRPQADVPADAEPAGGEPAGDQRMIPAMSSWARAFPGVPRQVSLARRFVSALLEGSPLRDDAVIVISELFTNALQHSDSGQPGGLVVVQVSRWRLGVRIAVTDQGSAQCPVIRGTRPASQDEAAGMSAARVVLDPLSADDADAIPADCGHGLFMVSCLAEHLDWHDDARGRTVHAVLGRLPAVVIRPA
jgi:serine/threonine-protein kinase RsbW